MRQWLVDKRKCYTNALLDDYGPPQTPEGTSSAAVTRCGVCIIGKAVWRCRDCLHKAACCVLCFRQRHDAVPFHNVEKWNGRFWTKGCLWEVGVKIHSGHGGAYCPSRPEFKGTVFGVTGTTTALTDLLHHVAEMKHTTSQNILSKLSKSLDEPLLRTEEDKQLLSFVADTAGTTVEELVTRCLEAVNAAERQANEEQRNGDRSAAILETCNENMDSFAEDSITDLPLGEEALKDDIWEDEVNDDERHGSLPRVFPRPPPTDALGNTFITVVHSNGFHHLPLVWCCCDTQRQARDIQLLELRLYPASYKTVKTAFTFDCLDNQRMENLECKTSIFQYHQKLRRLTYPAFPQYAPNRLVEFRRISRQWRNLKYRKWFGHWGDEKPGRGEMALFCPACPQPGINLPPDWKEDKLKSESV